MDANEAKKRYSRYNKRVKEYMGFVIDELFDKYLDIQESFVISLDLLAVNIEIFYDSLKEIREAGVTANDQYRGPKKNAAIGTLFNAQDHVVKILNQFGFNPLAKSKLKEKLDDVNDIKMLTAITNC